MKVNFDLEKKLWQKLQSAHDRQLGEAGTAFKGRGLNHFKILTAASNGDEKGMALFYSVCAGEMDGAAVEDFFPRLAIISCHRRRNFREISRRTTSRDAQRIAEILSSGDQDPISKPKPYIKRYFPKSYKLLFANERWPSQL